MRVQRSVSYLLQVVHDLCINDLNVLPRVTRGFTVPFSFQLLSLLYHMFWNVLIAGCNETFAFTHTTCLCVAALDHKQNQLAWHWG